ncbi:MAG TPA: restriction endonuclease [Pirellulales bacterium]|jgi:hypothetical protein
MTSLSAWRDYQLKTAEFFCRLGLGAAVESLVDGARGRHKIDVLVQGKYHGIEFRWIVECKDWKANVPKEKVMALASIVQDVGADRGFLLSEKGFQSGAVRAAAKTNITLTSLADLSEATEEHFLDAAIGALNWRLIKARNRLRDIKKREYDDEFFPPTVTVGAELMILESMLEDAAKGEYPIIYNKGNSRIESVDELLVYANNIISSAEKWQPPTS